MRSATPIDQIVRKYHDICQKKAPRANVVYAREFVATLPSLYECSLRSRSSATSIERAVAKKQGTTLFETRPSWKEVGKKLGSTSKAKETVGGQTNPTISFEDLISLIDVNLSLSEIGIISSIRRKSRVISTETIGRFKRMIETAMAEMIEPRSRDLGRAKKNDLEPAQGETIEETITRLEREIKAIQNFRWIARETNFSGLPATIRQNELICEIIVWEWDHSQQDIVNMKSERASLMQSALRRDQARLSGNRKAIQHVLDKQDAIMAFADLYKRDLTISE
jgi:hypothetical protein